MEMKELEIQGCYIIQPIKFEDHRGVFVKTYNDDIFEKENIKFDIKEEYFSISHKGVFRGMHFQLPPYDHMKMVYCAKGKVFDVFVDIRISSATYGKACALELSEDNRKIVLLSSGVAHGFCALEDDSLVVYKTSTVYSPEHDSGIHWQSIDIEWPEVLDKSLVSERDKRFGSFSEFKSPFK